MSYNPKIKISREWQELLADEFQKPYFEIIRNRYKQAQQETKKKNKHIFPPPHLLFHALNLTPPKDVKIVILGQDPYHGSQFIGKQKIPEAMGLSFSVPYPLSPPPSLKNIYKELARTLDFQIPNHGDLTPWSERGVLLLNSILSVEEGIAGSHSDFGWENFSDAIIEKISQYLSGVVFMLWGSFAKKKIPLINNNKHSILTAPHPSPLARGFIGSDVFLKANKALKNQGIEMDWSLPNRF